MLKRHLPGHPAVLFAFLVACAVQSPAAKPAPAAGPAPAAEPARVNPFRQRQIAIGSFENPGDARYSSLSGLLESSFFTYARTLTAIALSDEERSFLQARSVEGKYAEPFREAGGEVRYLLEPEVVTGRGDADAFPISISGSYEVDGSGERGRLTARAYNPMTGRVEVERTADLPLADIYRNPEVFLVPFFREMLRYKAHTATFLAAPEDSLIYVDERLVGVGRALEILLPGGPHRLSVKRAGYVNYTTLIDARSDGAVYNVTLKALEMTRALRFVSIPEGAELYIDGRYAGITPVETLTSGNEQSFILVKEGYQDRLLTALEVPRDGGEVQVSLIPLSALADIASSAERHRKRAALSYGGGIGALGLAILFGTQKSLYEQEADLYHGTDPQRSSDAASSAHTFGVLTAVSAVASAGFFVLAFVETVRYFKLYGSGRSGKPR